MQFKNIAEVWKNGPRRSKWDKPIICAPTCRSSDVPDNKIDDIVVVLDSPGGAFVPAIKIAEQIRAYHWRTRVDAGVVCTSSCAFIWLAGAPREATSTSMIGFHRVYLTTRDRKYFEEDPFGNRMVEME